MSDRITANLPSRDFAATIAFYGKLGFGVRFQGPDWLIPVSYTHLTLPTNREV